MQVQILLVALWLLALAVRRVCVWLQDCCWFIWCLIAQMAEDSRDAVELVQHIDLGMTRRNSELDIAAENRDD